MTFLCDFLSDPVSVFIDFFVKKLAKNAPNVYSDFNSKILSFYSFTSPFLFLYKTEIMSKNTQNATLFDYMKKMTYFIKKTIDLRKSLLY